MKTEQLKHLKPGDLVYKAEAFTGAFFVYEVLFTSDEAVFTNTYAKEKHHGGTVAINQTNAHHFYTNPKVAILEEIETLKEELDLTASKIRDMGKELKQREEYFQEIKECHEVLNLELKKLLGQNNG